MFKKEDLVSGAFLKIQTGEDSGLWKVVKVDKYTDGQSPFYRATLDKDLGKLGDERILEFFDYSEREVSIFRTFEKFAKEDAVSWPPPQEIKLTHNEKDVVFKCLHKADDPLIAFISGEKEVLHWEYQNDDGTLFLSIYNELGMVFMNIGYPLSVGMLDLT